MSAPEPAATEPAATRPAAAGPADVRVVADHERCVGSGQCVLTAPGVFDQSDEDGTVRVVTERPGPGAAAAARRAVDRCPARALSLRAG